MLYKNGVLQHTQTGIADAQYYPALTHSDNNATSSVNFASVNLLTEAPSGYKAVCTTSLPTPAVADGSDYFDQNSMRVMKPLEVSLDCTKNTNETW